MKHEEYEFSLAVESFEPDSLDTTGSIMKHVLLLFHLRVSSRHPIKVI